MEHNLVSTRDGERTDFQTALLRGQPSDGGLYVPSSIPSLDPKTLDASRGFASVCLTVARAWLGDSGPIRLGPGTLSGGGSDCSPSTRTIDLDRVFDFAVPIVLVDTEAYGPVRVVELFHGPTGSFKDFGARFLAAVMNAVLEIRDEHRTVLVATSGDTGSAVADAFSSTHRVNVVLLYPHGQVSRTQEYQLTQPRSGVTVLAVDGSFDDCQAMVKSAFAEPDAQRLGLTSANSINIGRLLPQMFYYHWAFANHDEGPATFCIPCGNLGNLTAGYLALKSGLPVDSFVAAHNANSWFHGMLRGAGGESTETIPTLSTAMDVGFPSNAERLLSLASLDELRRNIWSTSIDDVETEQTMREVFDQSGYILDPHTAVGFAALKEYRRIPVERERTRASGSEAPRSAFVLSTAHPGKFTEVVSRIIDHAPPAPWGLSERTDRPTCVQRIPAIGESLMQILRSR